MTDKLKLMKWAQKQTGFTIVELLIVVVVIAILATITVAAYTGVSANARDSQRKSDVASIAKALELYYIDNGRYPTASGSTTINSGWSTTVDASWAHLRDQLVPKYMSALPVDPENIDGVSPQDAVNGRGYAYFVPKTLPTSYCGVAPGQMYILIYRLSASPRTDNLYGDCTTMPLYYSALSNYRVVK